MRIQFITFSGCPNALAAREALGRVLAASGIAGVIEDVDTSDPSTPEALRNWGSPTVLIDGVDAGGSDGPEGPGCRLYVDEHGVLQPIPPESMILAGLRRAAART